MKRAFALVLLAVVLAGSARAGAGERIAGSLRARGVPPEAIVLIVSVLPVAELRGALPVGFKLLGLPLWKSFALSVAGNMVPIFVLVFFLERLVGWLSRVAVFRRFFDWLFRHTRDRSAAVARFRFWGILLLVGTPLPGTGAYTGVLAAVVLGLSYWQSLGAIFLGNLVAATLVSILCLLGVWGAVIAGAVLAALLARAVVAAVRRRARPATAVRP